MNKDMQQYLDKAEVLIEALPYIQRFNRKIIVVKYGGSAMVDEELKARVIQDVTLLKLVGFKPIIVHGGGKEISRWVGKVGMKPEFKNGLRVTDEATMELAEMVLGKVIKSCSACREPGSPRDRHQWKRRKTSLCKENMQMVKISDLSVM